MFRVPSDAAAPSFDQTFKVGFMQWMTSSKADRDEWAMRRNIAARLAQANQSKHIDESVAAHREQHETRRAELVAQAAQIRAEIRAKLQR